MSVFDSPYDREMRDHHYKNSSSQDPRHHRGMDVEEFRQMARARGLPEGAEFPGMWLDEANDNEEVDKCVRPKKKRKSREMGKEGEEVVNKKLLLLV